MTVKQMRQMLKGLSGYMPVMIDIGEGVIISVCEETSQVVELPLLDAEDDMEDFENDVDLNDFYEHDLEEGETIKILLLVPCNHVHEMEEGELNSQPKLN